MTILQLAIVPVTLFQQNCTIIWDKETKDCMVVDPGGEPGRIIDALRKLEVLPSLILLTHGHLDHAGGALALKGVIDEARTKLGLATAPVIGPDKRDQFLLDGIEASAAKFGITGLRNVTPDRWLTEGEVITLGSLNLQVLHCPGHTPGHIVFVDPAAKLALVGDVIFKNGVGRTDFEYGDTNALISSIHQKLLPLGDDIAFICGHGEGSTFGAERKSNPFLQDAVHS